MVDGDGFVRLGSDSTCFVEYCTFELGGFEFILDVCLEI